MTGTNGGEVKIEGCGMVFGLTWFIPFLWNKELPDETFVEHIYDTYTNEFLAGNEVNVKMIVDLKTLSLFVMARLRFGSSQEGAGTYVIYQNYNIIAEGAEFVHTRKHNVAEYTGLIIGLQKCIDMGITDLDVEGDSLLVISQLTKKVGCKQKYLIPLLEKVSELANNVTLTFHLIRKEYNSYTNSLSIPTKK